MSLKQQTWLKQDCDQSKRVKNITSHQRYDSWTVLSGPPILSLIHGRQLTDPNPGAHWRFVVTLDGSWKSVSSDKYVTKKTQSVKKKRFVQHKY